MMDQSGAGSEAAQKLLKDFPQIKTRAHDGQIFASGLGFYLKKVGAGRGKGIGDYGDPGGSTDHGTPRSWWSCRITQRCWS